MEGTLKTAYIFTKIQKFCFKRAWCKKQYDDHFRIFQKYCSVRNNVENLEKMPGILILF